MATKHSKTRSIFKNGKKIEKLHDQKLEPKTSTSHADDLAIDLDSQPPQLQQCTSDDVRNICTKCDDN